MKKLYKNTIDLRCIPDPTERKKNISKNIVRHADYMPKTLSYEDIDRSFKEWVETQIDIKQDNVLLPTFVLYSNQRFSEYSQTWAYTDENNNIRLNFKTVTRDNNPSHGTIVGETTNIPGERFYTFHSIQAIDESGKKYRIDYKMKQPTAVDFIYKVSIMTNQYTTINSFNEKIQQLFNAKQSYICPNGHFMSITLENINDESEYNIDDRQFFSQTINLKIKGYIIKEDDFRIEENPIASVICFDGDNTKRSKPTIELSEYDPCVNNDGYMKKPIDIDIDFTYCYPCNGKAKFTMDEDFIVTGIEYKTPNNIVEDNIKLYINNVLISDNLHKDAFEGYIKLDNIPSDSNEENTTEYESEPILLNKYYKYIKYKDSYYKWHKINFSYGDDIMIVTKRIKKHLNASGLKIIGYNRFDSIPVISLLPETLYDIKNNEDKENIIVEIPTNCFSKD